MRLKTPYVLPTLEVLVRAALVAAAICAPVSRGNAYAVDDADIGPAGSCQNESWVSFATSRDFVGVVSPACVVTIGIPVEFTALGQRTGTNHDWATANGGQAKIVPYNTDQLALSLALAAARDVTVGRDIVTVNFPATIKFGREFRIHANLGYLYDGRTQRNCATSGIGFNWNFREKFSLMGEVYLQEGGPFTGGRSIGIPSITQPRTQIGLQYSPVPSVEVLAIYG